MATQTLISEAEFLATSFESPEPDYVDGELVPRSMPNIPHSRIQFGISHLFGLEAERLHLYPCTELRMRVAPGRYRTADIAVFANEEPKGLVPTAPPLVVAEIVSPDDKYEDIMAKLSDYDAWGVPHIWLVDPALGRFSVYSRGNLTLVKAFEIPELGLRLEASRVLP